VSVAQVFFFKTFGLSHVMDFLGPRGIEVAA